LNKDRKFVLDGLQEAHSKLQQKPKPVIQTAKETKESGLSQIPVFFEFLL